MPSAVRKVVAGAVIGALVGAAYKALRGDPAPAFSNGSAPAAPAGASVLVPVADVAADEPPAPELNPDVLADAPAPASGTWLPPDDGACPAGYPVKAKLKSGLYHLPGMFAYDRTNPDRCYPSAEAAEADGLRPAKR